MKISYKELRCNKNDAKYTIVVRCIRRCFPEVEQITIRKITNIYSNSYKVYADLEILNTSVQQAMFSIIIPTDMRKKIIFMPFYSKTMRHTKVAKSVNEDDIILYIREYYCFDTVNFDDSDIMIREETIRFRIKPRERVLVDYYSLYIDSRGILRMHNRDSISDDITYIYAEVDIGYEPSLYPGYIKKSIYSTAFMDYKKNDRIIINRLVHNFSSTRYCMRYRDVIYMPVIYMNYVRGLLRLKKWG